MVERARLESVCPVKSGVESSNLSLSAKICYTNFGEISPFCKAKRRIRHIEMDMNYVYILLNETKTRTYTGVADDVEKRLNEHNTGRVKSSRPYRPYKIFYTESFATLSEARQKEKFYKSTTGRRRLKEMLLSGLSIESFKQF